MSETAYLVGVLGTAVAWVALLAALFGLALLAVLIAIRVSGIRP